MRFLDEWATVIYTFVDMATRTGKAAAPVKRRKEVRKDQSVLVRLTVEQKEILTAAATRVGLGLSTWILTTALKAAQDRTA